MDTGIIGRPGNENDLVAVLHALSITAAELVGGGHWADVHVSAVKLEAKVVDSVAGSLANSTLILHQVSSCSGVQIHCFGGFFGGETNSLALGGGVEELLTEVLPVAVGLSVLDLDLGVVVGQLEDDVSQHSVLVVAALQVLERLRDLGGNLGSTRY